jgi:hypothetical protein
MAAKVMENGKADDISRSGGTPPKDYPRGAAAFPCYYGQ